MTFQRKALFALPTASSSSHLAFQAKWLVANMVK